MTATVYSLSSHAAVAILLLVAAVSLVVGLFVGRASGKALGYEKGRHFGWQEGFFSRREYEALHRHPNGQFKGRGKVAIR